MTRPAPPPRAPANNQLLAALLREEYKRLLPHLEWVRLPQNKILYEAGDIVRHVYFPANGMVSLLSVTEDGQTVEVGIVGNEGVVGICVVLKVARTPYKVKVQIPASAMRIRADVLRREFGQCGQLQDLLLHYAHMLLTQISQSAACNRFHSVEQRLCRWLLISRDRVQTDTLQLTQESLSHMLGSPRTSVTAIAVALQKAGLIRYRRGQITITNAAGLETASCECYRLMRDEINTFLAA